MPISDGGSEARFKKEMLPHMEILFNYGLYLTGDRDAASDLLQETYLKAFRFFSSFEDGTNAKAWLYRIMRNTYINEYRRVKRIPDHVEYDEQISPYQMTRDAMPKSDNLPMQLAGEMFGDEVAEAIAGLPEKFKSVIILRDVEDLPYEEIAEALEIPVGTVRSRLHRARAILFDQLKGFARSHGYGVREGVGEEYALAS